MHAFGAHLPLEKCKKPRTGRGFLRIYRGRADDPFRYIGFSRQKEALPHPSAGLLLNNQYRPLPNRTFPRKRRRAPSAPGGVWLCGGGLWCTPWPPGKADTGPRCGQGETIGGKHRHQSAQTGDIHSHGPQHLFPLHLEGFILLVKAQGVPLPQSPPSPGQRPPVHPRSDRRPRPAHEASPAR